MWRERKREAARQWQVIRTPECVDWIKAEVRLRHAAGNRAAARDVAFEVLEDVWLGTRFRRLANLAYRQALAIGRASLLAHDAPARHRRDAGLSQGRQATPLPIDCCQDIS